MVSSFFIPLGFYPVSDAQPYALSKTLNFSFEKAILSLFLAYFPPFYRFL